MNHISFMFAYIYLVWHCDVSWTQGFRAKSTVSKIHSDYGFMCPTTSPNWTRESTRVRCCQSSTLDFFFFFLGRIQPSILWGSNMKIREQVGYPPNRGILPTAKRALNASCIKRLVGKPKLVSSYTCIFQVLQRSYKNISKRINII